MWKMDKHLVSTKYLRWIYAVHEYEQEVCPKNGFAPKYERLGDQKADSCTNPQNQRLAAAHLSQILQ